MLIYPIPGKYSKKDQFDVSVIVPMFKSKEVIRDQIKRWPTTDRGLKVEIIYVDDKCPQHSSQAVMQEWNKRRDRSEFSVKLVLNQHNKGFGGACNTGAYHANGKYLVFLNADTVPNPNWLWPILQVFENESKAGIVGNLQLKEGGEWHGCIDSAGSEWYWPETNFLHIGRHILNGEHTEKPLKPNELHLILEQREMVTGCCLAIKRELFQYIGGFNHNYRIGYWEDSELCMTVKDLGYKVLFTPESIIWHKLSHAKVGAHQFHEINKQYFMNKWEATGRFDPFIYSPRPIPRNKPKMILIRRKAANGDVLLAAGVAAALKKKHPGLITHFSTVCPTMLYDNPSIDRIVDDVEAFNNLHRYQFIVELDNAYERRPTVPILEVYAQEAGVPVEDMEFHMFHKKPNIELPKDYIVMHPGLTNWVGRNWNIECFEDISQRLIEKGNDVICIGNGGDREVTATLNLKNQLNLYEMAWVIKHAKYFIGIDSMPMHIAQVFETPGIAYFGAINPDFRIFRKNMKGLTAPDLACLGCHHRRLPPCTTLQQCETRTMDCEHKLTVNYAWRIIREHLCNQNT